MTRRTDELGHTLHDFYTDPKAVVTFLLNCHRGLTTIEYIIGICAIMAADHRAAKYVDLAPVIISVSLLSYVTNWLRQAERLKYNKTTCIDILKEDTILNSYIMLFSIC